MSASTRGSEGGRPWKHRRTGTAAQPGALQLVDDPAEERCERDEVLAALGRLSDGDQEVLTLVAWDGLSNAEVAGVLGASRQSVALRLHRARQRLRRELGESRAAVVHIEQRHREPTAISQYLAGEET
ncbi:MAG: RNA polymerase sigma factor [Acidimicrobiales bacterium]